MLRRWREYKVRPYLYEGARVLDIGCGDGSLFRQFRGRFSAGVGVDPALKHGVEESTYRLVAGSFPDHLPAEETFDVISLLAVLEHIPQSHQPRLALSIAERLRSGGHLIVTVPSPRVDAILSGLRALRLIHGMALEQHYGFPADRTPEIFDVAGLRLVRWRRFQLGLNNLFVFQKPVS
jgi:2-polyprenyl-3-methyl-5-hydroxy-6-metoxy-1,4-benzoquinol methylase